MAEQLASVVQCSTRPLGDLLAPDAAESGRLYAILDACDEPRVLQRVRELGNDRAVSLYRGWAERDYTAIAPYLARIDRATLDWIIANLWKDPWGILLVSGSDLSSLRTHLRRYLLVTRPDGQQVYFRFYDPRVLPVFLLSADPREAAQFFGPISEFWVTGEDGSPLRIFRTDRPATHLGV
jgi:hypothetical protein